MSSTVDEAPTQQQPTPEEAAIYAKLDARLDPFEAEFAPDICNTLGLMAVKNDLTRGVILTEPEIAPWLSSETDTSNTWVARSLQETRERIEVIEPSLRSHIGGRIIRADVPQFLLDSLGVDYGFQVFERLVEKDDEGRYVVNDQSLLNVLQWHNHQMTKRRERFMSLEWPRLQRTYKYELETAVKDGWLPACVIDDERLRLIQKAEVTIDDGMLLHEDQVTAFMRKYHNDDNENGHELVFPQYTYMVVAFHEMNHIMEGSGPIKVNDAVHGLKRLFGGQNQTVAARALNEAVTEHIAHTLNEPRSDPDDILGKVTSRETSHYNAERKLLNVLCNGGVKPVDVRLFINAYFENSTKWKQPAFRKLKKELRRAFPGQDVLAEFGKALEGVDETNERSHIEEFTIQLALNTAKRKSSKHRKAT